MCRPLSVREIRDPALRRRTEPQHVFDSLGQIVDLKRKVFLARFTETKDLTMERGESVGVGRGQADMHQLRCDPAQFDPKAARIVAASLPMLTFGRPEALLKRA